MYPQTPDVHSLFGPTEEEETWFVAFGPNDVRALTLEQLDDAYRLDVIDDDTLVQSSSMGQWQRLGEVLGADDEVEEIDDVEEIGAPTPRTVPRAAAAPFNPFTSQAPSVPAAPFPSFAPSPLVQTPRSTSAPPLASVTSPFSSVAATRSAPPSLQPPLPSSMAPTAFDITPALPEPHLPRSRSYWAAPLLLAALVGGLLVGHRSGAAAHLAGRLGMEGRYTKLAQQAFGAPGIDTPAGTQALIDEMRRTYRLDELSALSLRYSSGTVTTSNVSAKSESEPVAAPDTRASESKSEGVDIGSLPPAQEPEASKPAAARPTAAVAKASTTSTKPAIPTHLHLDTDAMRAALERSKARSKKSKVSEAQQYDPLFNSQQ